MIELLSPCISMSNAPPADCMDSGTKRIIIMLFFFLLFFLLCYTLGQNPPVQEIGLLFFMDIYFTSFVILLIRTILQHSNRGHFAYGKDLSGKIRTITVKFLFIFIKNEHIS